MDIQSEWNQIRSHFSKCLKSNFHVSIASVDTENFPTVTPIGSLFLDNAETGFYFEKYPNKLRRCAEHNSNVCVLAVNSGFLFWVRSLIKGGFYQYPAIRLYGELGELREAKPKELDRLHRRMRLTKGTKGNSYLWGDMKYVREIKFNKAEMVQLGKMTSSLV